MLLSLHTYTHTNNFVLLAAIQATTYPFSLRIPPSLTTVDFCLFPSLLFSFASCLQLLKKNQREKRGSSQDHLVTSLPHPSYHSPHFAEKKNQPQMIKNGPMSHSYDKRRRHHPPHNFVLFPSRNLSLYEMVLFIY